MKAIRSKLQNNNGSVTIIAALLILVVLTLIGISATNTTVTELQIAANDQFSKIAFFNGDSGLYGAPKVISNIVNTSQQYVLGGADSPGIQYAPGGTPQIEFFEQVMGYRAYDGGIADLDFGPGGITTTVDARRDRAQNIVGGAAEFASGAEGIGAGSTGGVAIFYDMRANAQGPPTFNPTIAQLGGEYRKVVGLAGGL